MHSAGAGLAPAVRALPGGPIVATALERFPAATERAYGFVASQRSRFGRLIPALVKRRADALIERRS